MLGDIIRRHINADENNVVAVTINLFYRWALCYVLFPVPPCAMLYLTDLYTLWSVWSQLALTHSAELGPCQANRSIKLGPFCTLEVMELSANGRAQSQFLCLLTGTLFCSSETIITEFMAISQDSSISWNDILPPAILSGILKGHCPLVILLNNSATSNIVTSALTERENLMF